jgi:hypothetical protein
MPPRPPHDARGRAAALKRRRACTPGASFGPWGTNAVTREASPLLHLASPQADDSGGDWDGTEIAAGSSNDWSGAPAYAAADDSGAQDPFVAALSCQLLPGVPYTPGPAGPVEVQRSQGRGWSGYQVHDENCCAQGMSARVGWAGRGDGSSRVGLGFIYLLYSSVATVGQLKFEIFYATLSHSTTLCRRR